MRELAAKASHICELFIILAVRVPCQLKIPHPPQWKRGECDKNNNQCFVSHSKDSCHTMRFTCFDQVILHCYVACIFVFCTKKIIHFLNIKIFIIRSSNNNTLIKFIINKKTVKTPLVILRANNDFFFVFLLPTSNYYTARIKSRMINIGDLFTNKYCVQHTLTIAIPYIFNKINTIIIILLAKVRIKMCSCAK